MKVQTPGLEEIHPMRLLLNNVLLLNVEHSLFGISSFSLRLSSSRNLERKFGFSSLFFLSISNSAIIMFSLQFPLLKFSCSKMYRDQFTSLSMKFSIPLSILLFSTLISFSLSSSSSSKESSSFWLIIGSK